mmetsp:Transcript_36606/g.114275  ORF Transcript_36606/g.114275 Transcript_36606/m.114275 type:complete len:299 (-) Transcript_36606:527-1423(-)
MRSESPRVWRRTKYSPTILPIILAALLTAITVQPAGDQLSAQRSQSSHALLRNAMCHPMERHLNSSGGDTCGTTSESCCFSDLDRQGEYDADMRFCWNRVKQERYPMSCLLKDFSIAKHERSLLSNADTVALIVRTTFILLEFGSRPLKNAKKILSCGLICIWLYRYRFGATDQFANLSRLQPSFSIFAENASFVIFFLVVRLSLKMADLLKIFKRQKGLRVVKLVKLAKLVKIGKWFLLGNISWKLALKLFRMLKLLKVLKCAPLIEKGPSKFEALLLILHQLHECSVLLSGLSSTG